MECGSPDIVQVTKQRKQTTPLFVIPHLAQHTLAYITHTSSQEQFNTTYC